MKELEARFAHYASRLDTAMKSRKLTNEGLAERIDAHSVTISKLRRNRLNLDDEWRAKVAAGLSLPEDVLFGHEPLPDPRPYEMFISPKKAARARALARRPMPSNIPMFGLAAGAMQGHHAMTNDPIEEVPCPPALRDVVGAYALKTRGDSMAPRFKNGARLYVNPHQKPHRGDDVIIQVRNYEGSGTDTWVKEFEGEDEDTIYVSQHNPPARMEFRKRFVIHVHRVVPIEELFEDS